METIYSRTYVFKERVHAAYGEEFEILGDWVGNYSPIYSKHKTCGKEIRVSPAVFLDCIISGTTPCYICFSRKRMYGSTDDKFKNDVEKLVGSEYTVVGDYVSARTPILMKHNTCGNTWETSPWYFKSRNVRCPNCVFSRGEKAVADVLDSLSIEYTREHSFEYLGRKRFDFFIPSLNIAIEYDGEQHFKAVDHWGGEEALKRTQESDALKNDFCDFMGIDLLRIPYWEFDNIDEVVTKFIDTVKLMRSISANGSEMAKCR